MQHHGYAVPKRLYLIFLHVVPRNLDRAACHVVKPWYKLHQRALRAARAAYYAYGLAGSYFKIYVLKVRVIGVAVVAEGYVVKLYRAVRNRNVLGVVIVYGRLFRKHFGYSCHAGAAHNKHYHHHGDHHNGAEHLPNIAYKAYQVAGLQPAFNYLHTAKVAHGYHTYICHILRKGHCHNQQFFGLYLIILHLVCGKREAFVLVIPAHECLDHADSRQVLLHVCVHCIELGKHGLEPRECFAHQYAYYQRQYWQREQEHQCKIGAYPYRHHRCRNQHERRAYERTHGHHVCVLDGIHVRGKAGYKAGR